MKQHVTAALDHRAAVALIGARQVRETTLAQDIAEEHDALYLDLMDTDDRQAVHADTVSETIGRPAGSAR